MGRRGQHHARTRGPRCYPGMRLHNWHKGNHPANLSWDAQQNSIFRPRILTHRRLHRPPLSAATAVTSGATCNRDIRGQAWCRPATRQARPPLASCSGRSWNIVLKLRCVLNRADLHASCHFGSSVMKLAWPRHARNRQPAH
jgi:hypothetical protein